MYYCNIVDNQIVTVPRPLPEYLTPETAVDNSWYPAVFLNMPHQVHSNSLTQLVEMKTRLNGTIVECWYEVVNKTDDQIELTRTLLLSSIREERNKKLLYSDWTQLPNAQLTESKKLDWETYRQLLRDFPNTVNLENIIWPNSPQ